MATLTERLDAICMGLGISNKEGIERAITQFVEREEYTNKMMEGCNEEHTCDLCNKKYKCWYFCQQTFHRCCKPCQIERNVDTPSWLRGFKDRFGK